MNRKSVLGLMVVFLFLSSSLMAQGFEFEPQDHKFEIIPQYGYVWTVSRSTYYNNYNGDLDIKNSPFWGVAVDINAKPGMQVRLLYRRQDTQLTWKSQGTTEDVGDIGKRKDKLGSEIEGGGAAPSGAPIKKKIRQAKESVNFLCFSI